MKIHVISYFLGFILLAAAASAIAEENRLKPLKKEEYKNFIADLDKGRDCIFSRTIGNWTLLDNQRMILYAPTKNRPYFVKLALRSHELKFAHQIGVYSKFDNRFCPYGGNALFIDGNRYTISAIKKIDKDTAKQLISFNKKDDK
ncbi:MAG: DUF6491 family protein [Emcibacter sp.]|nr:DUF6491 family protein [Emcibacter sp.]